MENKDTEVTQTITKWAFKAFIICCSIALICVLLFNWCHRSEQSKPVINEPDTIKPRIIKNNQTIQIHADSTEYFREQARKAWERKNFYKQKYLSLFDSVYFNADSTCKLNLQLVNQAKLKQDSAHEAENEANMAMIVSQFNQIELYQENQTLYDLRHKKDSSEISYLINDSIPKVVKSEFKRGRKAGRKQGFILGIGVSGAVWVGSKIKP